MSTLKVDTASRKIHKAKNLDELDSYRDQLNPIGDFDDDFFYYISNDDGRLQLRTEMGYEVVTNEEKIAFLDKGVDGLKTEGSVIGKPVGGGTQGILMKIPKSLKAQYDKQKSERVNRTENAMLESITDGSKGRHGTVETSSTYDT